MVDQNFVLKELQTVFREYGDELALVIIDCKQPHDSIDRTQPYRAMT